MIKTIKENIVFHNQFIKLYNNDVQFLNGSLGTYLKLSFSDDKADFGVACLVINKNKEIGLIKNYRYAHSKYSIECIKGFGELGYTALENIKKELKEEVGVEGKVVELGYSLSDMSENKIYSFISFDSKIVCKPSLEDSEVIESMSFYSVEEIKEMVRLSEITDEITLSLILQYFCFLDKDI